jgi:hypothetical protein
MSNILTIAYCVEGTTDGRFLESIISRTFEDLALECDGQIEVFDPIPIPLHKQDGFAAGVLAAAGEAFRVGINVLCLHVDADDDDDTSAMEHRIKPAFAGVATAARVCNNLVAIIPIQMSEAWMLAEIGLLKEEIGTALSDQDLGLTRAPESIADPKEVIINAVRIAQQDLPRRRDRITIADLYRPIGQKVSLERLQQLSSYAKFRAAVTEAYKRLNYLS